MTRRGKRRRPRRPLVQLVSVTRSSPPVPEFGSEIARLKAEIEAEARSARLGLYGEAQGTAQHLFITRRMERMGMLHEELQMLLPPEDAVKALIEAMERPVEPEEPA